MKPDDEAIISIFYCLGYTHGLRFSRRNVKGEPIPDRDQEKFLIDFLPPGGIRTLQYRGFNRNSTLQNTSRA